VAEQSSNSPQSSRPKASRYSLFVGLAFLLVIVVATVNTFKTRDDGILGTGDVDQGAPLPQFAVPSLDGLDGSQTADGNIFQDDCGSSSNPCDDPRTPACQVEVADAIRVCDYFDKPLVISFWFMKGADCLPTQDVVDAVAKRFQGRVNFLSIDVRDDPAQAHDIVDEHGWTIPVGYDADGAVSNLYRVGGCPTVAFAYPGGIFAEAKLGAGVLTEQSLTTDVDKLISDSDQRAETAR
jgi:thiol-disulfide isomerase/thioredoxin